jgi:hypothetical protein
MDFGNCFRFSRFWFYRLARSRSPKPPGLFRLARSRSPKPPGFGAGEAQRKCGQIQKQPRHLSGKALAAGSSFRQPGLRASPRLGSAN